MMKTRKISFNIYMIFLFILFFLTILSSATANPVVPYPYPPLNNPELLAYYGLLLVLIFIIYTLIEYIVIYSFLKESVKASFKARKQLYKIVLIINFFTFPIVIIISTAFTPISNNAIIEYVIIESFPIILETLFFLLAFNFLLERGYFKRPVSKRTTFLSTFSANILTFLLGFVILPIYVILAPF